MSSSTILTSIQKTGFCYAPAAQMRAWLTAENPQTLDDWARFAQSWADLPLDVYMADGGKYRRRRYATLSAKNGIIALEAHQPHYQSLNYNRLNGGIARDFAPIASDIIQSAIMQNFVQFCFNTFNALMPSLDWHIECHQFRIEALGDLSAKPTPEGVHRDGVDFVLVMMIQRINISSGTTTMHDLTQRTLDSFTLIEPLDCAIVNDNRCLHGVTPVQQMDASKPAFRDVLVITFRNKAV